MEERDELYNFAEDVELFILGEYLKIASGLGRSEAELAAVQRGFDEFMEAKRFLREKTGEINARALMDFMPENPWVQILREMILPVLKNEVLGLDARAAAEVNREVLEEVKQRLSRQRRGIDKM
ncbi:MAG TPA: hypothetical protein VMT81_01405 [Candidatus Paceibacterota bacterium]|nr:hypothetical protein [Candidatus Paceibacterota bacterium]